MVPTFILSLFSVLSLFIYSEISAAIPLTGSLSIPGNYPTLDSAIKDLNLNGVGSGGVTFNLLSGNPQTSPAGGYSITAVGTVTNQIIFNGNGNTITASSAHTTGSLTDAVFKLIGADYVTLTGFVIYENPSNSVSVPATNNMTEWGIALLRAATNNGSGNNTIRGNTITLKKVYANSFGIYSSTRHSATDVITVINAGSSPGINAFNKFSSNNISNVNFPICLIGSGAPGLLDTDNEIGGNSPSDGNTLTNFGGKAIGSAFAAFPLSMGFGIYADQQDGFNIANNVLFSDSAVLLTSFSGIYAQNSATTSYNSSDYTIKNNTITVFNALSSGILNGIYAVLGADVSTVKKIYISGNTIRDCLAGGNAGSSFNGIYNTGSMKAGFITGNNFINNQTASTTNSSSILNINNTSDSVFITDNNIGNASNPGLRYSSVNSVNQVMINSEGQTRSIFIRKNNFYGVSFQSAGTGGITLIKDKGINHALIDSNRFIGLSINNSGPVKFISREPVSILNSSVIDINDNQVVTGFAKPAAGDTVTFITGNNYLTLSSATINIKRNVMFNFNLTGNTSFSGIIDEQGNPDGSFSLKKVIENNLISTIANSSSSTQLLRPVRIKRCASGSSITGNMINTITWNGNTVSRLISADSIKIQPLKISDNVINGINTFASCTGVSVLSKYKCEVSNNIIYVINTGSTSNGISIGTDTSDIYMNKIASLSGTTTGRGIHILSGKVNNIYNNIIGDIQSQSGMTNPSETGIYIEGTAVNNLYYNTIRLKDVPGSGLTAGSACLYIAGASSLLLVNNIMINLAPETFLSNKAYVIRSSTLITGYYNNSSNNNLYYIFEPGSGRYIYSDGTNNDQTLTAFKTRVSPRDSSSVTSNVVFKNYSGNSDDYLHVNDSVTNLVEGKGKLVAGINNDYDGEVRQGSPGYMGTDTAPDIGADEFFTGPSGNLSVNLTFLLQGFYNPSADSQTGDTAQVNIRAGIAPYNLIDSARAFFNSSGSATVSFMNSPAGNYYLEIRHRNSISTWSSLPLSLSPGTPVSYTFADSVTKAYGSNLANVDAAPVSFAVFGADVIQDGIVNVSDIIAVYNAASVFTSGYVISDITGDNVVNINDIILTYNNSALFVMQENP